MPGKVIIASRNPVKIDAVKIAFRTMFPEEQYSFVGISVPSGVQDQPMSNLETLEGASNRAGSAKESNSEADFWVGIEGGVEKAGSDLGAFAWIVIKSLNKTGKARTGTFFLPKKIISLIEEGKELGEADDMVFGHTNSKQKNGAVGILTGNAIDRTSLYSQAVVLALIPFKNTGHY